MNDLFFDNWQRILNIAITGILVYSGLIIILRISGKRTLSQMNAFDFIATVALGSTMATAILSKDVTLTEGLSALVVLILLQFLVAWIYVRVPWFNNLVKSQPRLLFYQGNFKQEAMKTERIEKDELLQAARSEGLLSLNEVAAIVLETNGKISIIKTSDSSDQSTLQNIPDLENQIKKPD